jgi:hypothetical protein
MPILRKLGPFSQQLKKNFRHCHSPFAHFSFFILFIFFLNQNRSNHLGTEVTLVTRLKQHFWKRWSREYLGQLQQRNKWATSSAQKINIGSLVVLIEDNTPPLKWPLGRVVKLHPGKDGITRVVTIQTQGASTVKRAVRKLCVLPVDTSDSAAD